MANKEWNVASADLSMNTLEVQATITNVSVSNRNGMWGEAMFASPLLLGSALTTRYVTGTEKNIGSLDLWMNVDRRFSPLVSATMVSRLGMWGESMFGTKEVLGAGTLNYFEG